MSYQPKNTRLLKSWDKLKAKLIGRTVGLAGYRARIIRVLDGPDYIGGVVLDKDIQGLAWWNMDSLTLYPKGRKF